MVVAGKKATFVPSMTHSALLSQSLSVPMMMQELPFLCSLISKIRV